MNVQMTSPRVENEYTFVEAVCTKTIPVSPQAGNKKTVPNKFTAGEIYIATLSARGNYIVDTDGGRELSMPPAEFLDVFRINE